MEIKTQVVSKEGKKFDIVYREGNPEIELNGVFLNGVSGHCFYGNKMVIVHDEKSGWWFPGGGIEKNETPEEAVVREVKEESNMKVLFQRYIGYQTLTDEYGKINRHASYFCVVKPYGDFVSDPDEDITEIKLIDPKDYKQYIRWGEVGDRIMEVAMKMEEKMK